VRSSGLLLLVYNPEGSSFHFIEFYTIGESDIMQCLLFGNCQITEGNQNQHKETLSAGRHLNQALTELLPLN
jgi:hypothetical protein